MTAPTKVRFEPGKLTPKVRGIRPVVCVDLGFSNKRKSCGVAILDSNNTLRKRSLMTFGEALKTCLEVVSGHDSAVLILEAPLSAKFAGSGNPQGREEIEVRVQNGKKQYRYWYSGPGASTMLGAAFFLARLRREINQPVTIHLFEGFLSFKQETSSDEDDASELLAIFRDSHTLHSIKPENGAEVVSILSLISDAPENPQAPEIVIARP